MSNLAEFKQAYERFIKALRYIIEKESELKKDPTKWERVKKNFFERFERPLDSAWLALSKDERKKLAPLYLHRRAQSEPTVKKVIEVFGAKIKSVTEGVETNEKEVPKT